MCGCSPKDPTNTNIESTNNPQITSWDTEIPAQETVQPNEDNNKNNDGNHEIHTDNENIKTESNTPNIDTDTDKDTTPTNTWEKLSTDEIVDKLTEYSKSWEFDEEWVDILYEIIDSLSE